MRVCVQALVVAAARRKDSAGFMSICNSLRSSRAAAGGAAAAAAALEEAHALHWAAFLGSETIINYLLLQVGCSPSHQVRV